MCWTSFLKTGITAAAVQMCVSAAATASLWCPEPKVPSPELARVETLTAIQGNIAAMKGAIYTVYEGARVIHGDFSDKVVYRLDFNAQGQMQAACVHSSQSTPSAVLEAIRYVLLSVRVSSWPEGKAVSIHYPIQFAPD